MFCGGLECANEKQKQYEREYYAERKSDPKFMAARRQKSRDWYARRRSLYNEVCRAVEKIPSGEIDVQVSVKAKDVATIRQRDALIPDALVERVLVDAIYALGACSSKEEAASRAGVGLRLISAISSAMKEHMVNPSFVVKNTHRQWKAAYDALVELGIVKP